MHSVGGKGGYSIGTLTISTDTIVYVYVGEKAIDVTTSGSKSWSGGYNGGGTGYSKATTKLCGGGGGASDIRIGQDSLYARVIVAGGGGGAGKTSTQNYWMDGGNGGGISGTAGSSSSHVANSSGGGGGTQYTKGASYYNNNVDSNTYGNLASFGTGGSYKSSSYPAAGGGGGWYGGGYGNFAGGGGSGYVYTSSTASDYPSGCLLNSSYYLSNAQTIAGNASFESTSGGTETGHEGNGYVRITRIS